MDGRRMLHGVIRSESLLAGMFTVTAEAEPWHV